MPESIGNLYSTKMPSLSESADIQEAFRVYHYGASSTVYDPSNTNTANLVNPSIAYTLHSLQTQINSATTGAILPSTFTAKGDILTATASSTPSVLAVGTNGYVLTANSATATGLQWVEPAVTLTNTATLTNKTLTSPTINTPILSLSSTSSTSSGRISFDPSADKIYVGDGTTAIEFAGSTVITNAQSGSTYTLVLSDKDKLVEVSNASANTLTIPLNSSVSFPVGSQIQVLQTGAGQTTIAGAVGVTVNATPGLKLRTQWSSATLLKRGTDTWVVLGDLVA